MAIFGKVFSMTALPLLPGNVGHNMLVLICNVILVESPTAIGISCNPLLSPLRKMRLCLSIGDLQSSSVYYNSLWAFMGDGSVLFLLYENIIL